jgi:hypothetical protein
MTFNIQCTLPPLAHFVASLQPTYRGLPSSRPPFQFCSRRRYMRQLPPSEPANLLHCCTLPRHFVILRWPPPMFHSARECTCTGQAAPPLRCEDGRQQPPPAAAGGGVQCAVLLLPRGQHSQRGMRACIIFGAAVCNKGACTSFFDGTPAGTFGCAGHMEPPGAPPTVAVTTAVRYKGIAEVGELFAA